MELVQSATLEVLQDGAEAAEAADEGLAATV